MTPSLPSCFASMSQSRCRRGHGKAMSPPAGSASSSPRISQSSAMNPLSLSRGIKGILERLGAKAPIGSEEGFFFTASELQIGLNDCLDGIRHLFGGKARTKNLADRSTFGRRAAKRDLVEFLAPLIQSEYADVTDVMVAARIDTAGNVDFERPDFLLPGEVGKPPRYSLRDRDRPSGGKRAIVQPGAGDDVSGKPDIRRREIVRFQYLPDG